MNKLDEIIEKVGTLTVTELAELVKAMETKFGISAAMPSGPSTSSGQAVEAEEKTAWDVVIKEGGGQKIQVIKVLREVTGLGLKEAKDLVDAAPKVAKAGLKKDEAEELKKKLEAAGAVVELK